VWLGWLAPEDASLLFVLGDAPLERVVEESLLVGYERFAGWLDGGLESWERAGKPVERTALVGADKARRTLANGAAALDVREPNEFAAGHLEGAIHVPLGDLERRLDELPRDRPIVVYCAHGERSTSAASILERHGLGPAEVLNGGFGAWQEAGLPAR
jgi:hydroxyacylglutathione hydrolase